MTNIDDTINDEQRQRHEQVRAVVRDCISRRAAGESVSDQELIDANSGLMPELGDKLRALQVIESAHRQVKDEIAAAQHGLNVRCPECHNPMAVSDDTPVSDIVCPSCGSSFGLDAEESEIHAGSYVGHFELLNKLGSGAFGSVWRTRDTELDRLVAVKIPRQSRLTQDETEQLIREARATAQLTHPNIVRIHEVGRDGGLVYLVTDLVTGQTLADWIGEHRMTPREAATLCATLADALHHAHEQGVIHRDLKPSNIMLDQRGKPHLMDFGLAKREVGEATMTVAGKLLGTPAYMSPEQARGTAHDADARSDVYSLGVILFQLLTGEPPFRGNVRMLIHQVLHEDAPRPRRLNSHVAQDLETICLKCLEKDPRRRYPTAREVTDELNRYLRGQPIVARPVSRAERLLKWCRRNPITAVLTTALAAALFLGLLGVSWQLFKTRAEAERNRRLLYVSDISKIAESWESGNVGVALRLLKRHLPDPGERDLRGFEWSLLWKRCQPSLLAGTLEREPVFAAFVMSVSPNGHYLAAAGGPGTVVVWDLETDEILHRLKGHDIAFGLAFSPDCQILASSGWDDKTCLWNVATGQQIGELPRGHGGVRFSHDGTLLAICDTEVVSVWDISNINNVEMRKVFQAPVAMRSAAFSLDDSVLACAGDDGRIRQWSIASEAAIEPPLEGHSDIVNTVEFSPDGKILVSGSNDNTVRLWDIDTRQELQSFAGHKSYVWSATFSPDGRTVASGSHDGTVKLWDVESGKLRDTLRGHDFQVWSVAFAPHGETLFTGGGEGVIRRWDLAARRPPLLIEGNGGPIAFDPRGKLLAGVRRDCEISLWDVSSGDEVATFEGHRDRIIDLEFSPDGKTVASATRQGTKLWDVDTLRMRHELDGVWSVAFSPDGNVVATGGPDGTIWLWEVLSGKLRLRLPGFGQKHVRSLTFSTDGKNLAAGGWKTSQNVVVYDALTGKKLATPKGHLGHVDSIAFCPKAEIACTGGFDGTIKLWNARTWTELETRIEGRHMSIVNSLAFSPDGKTLASASRDGTVKLWHAATGRHLFTVTTEDAPVDDVAFSPSGKLLVSSSGDGKIRLWPAATQEELEEASW